MARLPAKLLSYQGDVVADTGDSFGRKIPLLSARSEHEDLSIFSVVEREFVAR